MSPFRWHFAAISVPRARRIADAVVALAPATRSLLDIGCGDGTLAALVASKLAAEEVEGVDIKVQADCRISVTPYDGRQLPHAAASFDLVMINDVLHHAEDPAAVLSEALRVTRPTGAVIVKDHFRVGPWSNSVLLAMDVVGNFAQGIVVTGDYLSPPEWIDLVARAGGSVDKLLWPFDVHAWPFRMVTRSEYQFVARVVHHARTADNGR